MFYYLSKPLFGVSSNLNVILYVAKIAEDTVTELLEFTKLECQSIWDDTDTSFHSVMWCPTRLKYSDQPL